MTHFETEFSRRIKMFSDSFLPLPRTFPLIVHWKRTQGLWDPFPDFDKAFINLPYFTYLLYLS